MNARKLMEPDASDASFAEQFVRDVVARGRRSTRTALLALAGGAALVALGFLMELRTPLVLLAGAAVVILAYSQWPRGGRRSSAVPSEFAGDVPTKLDEVDELQLAEHGATWAARMRTPHGSVELYGAPAARALLTLLAKEGAGAGTEAEARDAVRRIRAAGGPDAYLRDLASRTCLEGARPVAGASPIEQVVRSADEVLPFEAALRGILAAGR